MRTRCAWIPVFLMTAALSANANHDLFAQFNGPMSGVQFVAGAGGPNLAFPAQQAIYAPSAYGSMAGQVALASCSGNCGGGCADPRCASAGKRADAGCTSAVCGGGCGTGCGSGLLGMGPKGWLHQHSPYAENGYAGGGFDGYNDNGSGGRNGIFGNQSCCAPRWFDVHAEWLFWQRDEISDTVDFTTDGILGPVVLSTDDLNFNEESGFRITGAYLIGPSTNLEVTYFGTFNWTSSAQVTSATDNLFSVFSDFGSLPFNGFQETGQANLHSIAYSSELNNGEVNLRRRWISSNCLYHGSYLAGARYLRLREDFEHFTQSPNGQLDSIVSTTNNLVGFQIGGDLYACVSSRFKVGGEVEAGVFGIRAKQETSVNATTTVPPISEFEKNNDVAFVSEASFIALFRVTPRFKIRAGYQLLYINGVALAPENYNTVPPFFGRNTFLDDNGHAFYHGASAGFEWTW